MSKYRHIFFDLDRTLWDFETNSHESLTELYDAYDLEGRGVPDAEEFIRLYKQINEEYWALYRRNQVTKEELRVVRFRRTLEHYGVHDEKLSRDFGLAYLEVTPRKPSLLPNAKEILQTLMGDHVLHIITNGFEEVQEIKLKCSGLDQFFTSVVTSEQVGHKKPDPRVFAFSLEQAGANKDEGIMIGDDLMADVLGAKSFGMDHVYYNPGKEEHNEEIMAEIADLLELRDLLS